MRIPFADSPEFRRLLDDEPDVSLAAVALEIARDAYPRLDASAYLAKIDAVAARARGRCGAGAKPAAVLSQINWILFVEERFRGNAEDYYDPRNSYLNEVLDRKTGIPISLSVVYAAVAERLGLKLSGVGLPAHFVLRLEGSDPPLFIDAFHEGRLLDAHGCVELASAAVGRPIVLSDSELASIPASSTVARMLRNLKAIYGGEGDFAAALPVVRRLAALRPSDLEEQRDWGLIAHRSGHPGEAVGPLARYVAARPDAADLDAVAAILRVARREVAQAN